MNTASASVAEALGLPLGAPIAVLDRVVRTIEGQPAEWRMAWSQFGENYYLVVID